ncbi:hypothetical protein ABT144_14560 [Streptomyces sp. NPDC002039]|uniref:hypothetical protein n=1 Tax=Streptomyces sp. NPDC002039 TaxID=3154660 RepID=UPI003333B735
MTRNEASPADRELLGLLHDRGLAVSVAQLERWRRARLLPRHARRALGRGRGSISVLDPRTVEIADILTRSSGQGKDLRATVLAWYMRAGTPGVHSRQPVPEPPFDAVRDALVWALRGSPIQRLIEQARRARDDVDTDDLYADADKFLARSPGLFGHPGRMRQALRDNDQDIQPPPRGGQRSMVNLIALLGLPPGEVSGESFAKAMTASGLFPWADSEMLVAAFQHAERDGTLDRLLREARQRDAVTEAEAVSPQKLACAREVARVLGLCGSLYLMHGLLLPDTPGQQAIRDKIDELGLGEIVITAAKTFTKIEAANTLSLCLDPYFAHLSEQLNGVLTQHIDGIFRRPGEDDSAEDFMAGWMTAIQDAAGHET